MKYTYDVFYFDLEVGREIEFNLDGHNYFIERLDIYNKKIVKS